LWSQEPVTLQAFYSLFNIGTIFNGFEDARKLIELLDESLKHQDEVTETLGLQVSRAVEVLVQSLDRINHDHNNKLLEGVDPTELYEAGLTLMMRLVFLLCAEERGLLLLGDETYEANYALSTLRLKLREEAGLHGEEVLSYRKNAWARLLAIFRAVYGGVEHENMRMPALGGSLFDPDRFPFLEGREKGTNWKIEEAKPLPIDNRTVLLFLDAIQIYQGRTLSYRALDVEQIGYVYEGLLEKTVVRATDVTLELSGSKSAKTPWVELKELASAELDGEESVKNLLKERTKSSVGRINSDLNKELTDAQLDSLLAACHNDTELRDRIKPYYHFLRLDAWANPLLYPKDAFMVTTGADRGETGAHYTPKSLTESIVETTLEPVAYVGPAEGKPREDWLLKSSAELLDLKICDPAMGSGAFLVQVCRWLSERLVEVWGKETGQEKFITVDGVALESVGSAEPMPDSLDERLLIARRLVAEKCLYGVDLNPLAVELAKLSIWLITLAKGRPFGFLDHNLRSGDSLLGLTELEQLTKFSLHPEKKQTISIFASNIEAAVKDALALRKQLRETPIRDIRDVQYMERLDQEARQKLEHIEHIADAMIGEALASGGNQRALDTAMDNLSTWAAAYIEGDNETGRKIIAEARKSLSIDLPAGKPPRKPFHWALEFPEVFERGGFDGIVGNPPFMRGHDISRYFGTAYRDYLSNVIFNSSIGRADLCSLFVLRAVFLTLRSFGFIATNSISEGDTRKVGIESALKVKFNIISAFPNMKWPGKASVYVSPFVMTKGQWKGVCKINQEETPTISSRLTAEALKIKIHSLSRNVNKCFVGNYVLGRGFVLSREDAEKFIKENKKNTEVIFPYINGTELNKLNTEMPERMVINFWDWSFEKAKEYKSVFSRIEQDVFSSRRSAPRKSHKEIWWLHAENRPGLYHAIGMGKYFTKHPPEFSDMASFPKKVIVKAKTSDKWVFTFLPAQIIFDQAISIIASDSFSDFAIVQSSIHETWARYSGAGSSMKTDLRYSPKMFETYPFPEKSFKHIEAVEKFYNTRQEFLVAQDCGLTEFYNQFNDEESNSDEILQLRGLFAEVDQIVCNAYGWADIDLDHGFHETKQGIRFTISEEARREVLQRLLKLNHERYEEEVDQGLHDKKKKKTSTPRKKKTSPAKDDGNLDLFNFMNASTKGSK